MYTLVLIDVQEKLVIPSSVESTNKSINKIISEIVKAIDNNAGVIICENNPEKNGPTLSAITDLLSNYKNKLQFEHPQPAVGQEVLAIIKQQGYDRSNVKLCGVNKNDSIKETIREIEHYVTFPINIEILHEACVRRLI